MSRSRAVNRSNRLVAKRRRRALRAALPCFQDGYIRGNFSSSGLVRQLRLNIAESEALYELYLSSE